MKRDSLLYLLGAAVVTTACTSAENKEQDKPNIIFILSDDMGVGDLSTYGGQFLPTPHLDEMAKEGIQFTRYYSASPISSPSRAGLLTGKHPANWNITSYLQTRAGNKEAEMADYLTVSAPTLPRALKAEGYKTAHFGKWHLGGGRDVHDAPSILEYGYDEYSSTYESPDPDPLLTATDWIWSKEDSIARWDRTAYFIDKTLDFLRENSDVPCFINLWPDDVHTPWIGNQEEMDLVPKGTNSKENLKTVLKEYDYQIGRLLNTLKEEGLDKNTIVIFTSDNGPAPSFQHMRGNGLRGQKASLFEGGIRMPFIVWGPKANIPSGRTDSTTIISALDMYVSLCAITGSSIPEQLDSDGEDMSSALQGIPQERAKPIYWEYKRNEGTAFPKARGLDASPNVAIRDGDWKLLVNHDGTDVMLFNTKEDLFEEQDVKEQYPEIAARLKEQALIWRNQLPTLGDN